MQKYFAYINSIVGRMNEGHVEQLRSKRIRGYCGYTDAANSFFQGLAARQLQIGALYGCQRGLLQREIRTVRLATGEFRTRRNYYGRPRKTQPTRPPANLASIMEKAMAIYTPDVPTRASPTLMRWWVEGRRTCFRRHTVGAVGGLNGIVELEYSAKRITIEVLGKIERIVAQPLPRVPLGGRFILGG